MIELTNFEVQNWLITPAALAFNESPPSTSYDQKWILVLTGSVDARLVGKDSGTADQDVHIVPDVISPATTRSTITASFDRPESKGPIIMLSFR